MKKLFLSLGIFLFSIPAFAQEEEPFVRIEYGACPLYDSMNVQPTNPEPYLYVKEITGLTCSYAKHFGEREGCICFLERDMGRWEREQIYDGLAIKEMTDNDFDTYIFIKTVGLLTFEKVTYIKYDREQRDYYFSALGEKYEKQY